MRSVKRRTWRNFVELCEKLGMPPKEVERLISKKGVYVIGDFILRVEREIRVEGREIPFVSLWKAGRCRYKGAVNPFLFEALDLEPEAPR